MNERWEVAKIPEVYCKHCGRAITGSRVKVADSDTSEARFWLCMSCHDNLWENAMREPTGEKQ